jgi:hypothetical protein
MDATVDMYGSATDLDQLAKQRSTVAAQLRPRQGRIIQRASKVFRFGERMTGSQGWHALSVTPSRSVALFWCLCNITLPVNGFSSKQVKARALRFPL